MIRILLVVAAMLFVASLDARAQAPINCPDTGGNHLNYLTATHKWICGTSAGASSLSALTAATTVNTINNGDNAQRWNWALTTASKTAFFFAENTASINGTTAQYLLNIATLPASTAIPFRVTARSSVDNILISNSGSISLTATGGTAGSGSFGETITLTGGTGASTFAGGTVSISGGAGGSSSGNGGTVQLLGGSATDGNGGVISITGRNGTGTNRNGGNVTISAGNNTGSGTKGNIVLRTSGSTEIFRLNGTSQHFSVLGTTPTITADCGTSPSIAGKDQAFAITVGTGGTDVSCTVTFANAFTNTPICISNHEGAILVTRAVPTTTTVVIDAATPLTAGGRIAVTCMSYE